MAFHDVRLSDRIAYGATGGPVRKVEIAQLSSGYEERNTPWAYSRHKYNVATGVKNMNDLHDIKSFFEARYGQLHGFRFKDFADFKSCPPATNITNLDQNIGTGNGVLTTFQVIKTYSSGGFTAPRQIKKLVANTLIVAVAGVAKTVTTQYTVNINTGVITFLAGNIPTAGQAVTCGYEFDVPARFDQDSIDINLSNFQRGQVDAINIVELRVRADGT